MLLGLIQQQVSGAVAESNFSVSDNLLGGLTLDAGLGESLTSFANATGGLTVSLGSGETASISENFYGGHTINFSDPTKADIVGRPGVFESETLYQGGTAVGTLEPTLLGDGVMLTTDAGTLLGSFGFMDTISLKIKAVMSTPAYVTDISSVSTMALTVDATSVADSFAVVEGLDGLDAFDLL